MKLHDDSNCMLFLIVCTFPFRINHMVNFHYFITQKFAENDYHMICRLYAFRISILNACSSPGF